MANPWRYNRLRKGIKYYNPLFVLFNLSLHNFFRDLMNRISDDTSIVLGL